MRSSIMAALLGSVALAAAACQPTIAAQGAVAHYHQPAGPLSEALQRIGEQAHIDILFTPEEVAGKEAPAIEGDFTLDEVLARVLAGSGLTARRGHGAIIIRRQSSSVAPAEGGGGEIVVTGSRIRGAPIASPVIRVDQQSLRNAGIADIGDAVRRIPQSFGGGQNPGIGMNVPSASGADVGGGSSVNLRGLGSDATLTLLNGRRLAYTAVDQSVDVSSIPISAIDRIELVPDGASAIYGSDAVAGVANIILRRDYDGIETSARLAGATDGGDFQQQYGALAGSTWSGGGILAAYEYASNTAIHARDRSYAASRSPGLDLFPAMHRHSAIASAHQRLGGGFSVEADGLYNIRWSDLTFPTTASGDLNEGRATFSSVDKAFAIAPALHLDLAHHWRVTLTGSYGTDRVSYHQVQCARDTCTDSGPSFYRNAEQSAELNGSGDFFSLPGGDARLAIGGGYRNIDFRRFSSGNAAVNTAHAQDSWYGFGELNLPFVGNGQHVPLIYRLDVNAALRYERYPGIGEVLTPKIGVIWGITPDLDIKGSWGKSFRAPTLYQQYQPRAVYLFPPAALGATGQPSTSGALLILGGNPELKPERATTWSATLALHPRALGGARFEVTYFEVVYRDRIVAPIALTREALSNPIYRDQITRQPSAAEQAATIASAATFLNLTGTPYDPANVIAIVDDANVNAGRRTAHGIDMLASYDFSIAAGQAVTLSGNLAYLDSDQQLSAGQPILPLAGVIFNPPHWRAEAIAGWSKGPITLTAVANYTGGVRDVRFDPAVSVDGMTTFDLTGRYRMADTSSLLGGLDLTLSIQNLFNAKPHPIAVSIPYDTPYDSTNYSPVGRLIALQVRKSW